MTARFSEVIVTYTEDQRLTWLYLRITRRRLWRQKKINKPLKCALLNVRQLLSKRGRSFEVWTEKKCNPSLWKTCHCGRPHDHPQDYYHFQMSPFNHISGNYNVEYIKTNVYNSSWKKCWSLQVQIHCEHLFCFPDPAYKKYATVLNETLAYSVSGYTIRWARRTPVVPLMSQAKPLGHNNVCCKRLDDDWICQHGARLENSERRRGRRYRMACFRGVVVITSA